MGKRNKLGGTYRINFDSQVNIFAIKINVIQRFSFYSNSYFVYMYAQKFVSDFDSSFTFGLV